MKIRIFVLMALVLAFSGAVMAMDDPFVGTWKLNVAKSKLTPPIPKTETVKIEALDKGLKHTFDGIYAADGKFYHQEWSPKFDGTDYPFTGDPSTDTGAITRIDSNTLEGVFKKAGKEVGRYRVTVSKDGKTLTATGKVKNDKGQDVSTVGIYEKQ